MKRLLVIRFGALGDLIHASAALLAVRQADPAVEIHLLTSPAYAVLGPMLPGVDQVWTWDKSQGWGALFEIAVQLRKTGMQGVVNLHPSFKSLLITGLLMPVGTAIYHKEKLKPKGLAQRGISRRHATQDFYQPFRQLLGLPQPLTHLPVLVLPESLSPIAAKLTGERWVGLIPGVGAKRSNRAWEPEAYIRLIRSLLQVRLDVKVLLFGGPDEQALAAQLMEALREEAGARLENHCGQHPIPVTAQWMAQCDVMIGGDTGPIHVAAALGVPILGIYGPTALARTGPVARTVSSMLTPPEGLACWPCELPECPYAGDAHLACMREISVAEVLESALKLLSLACRL